MKMNKIQMINELLNQITPTSENFELERLLRNKYPFLISDMEELENFLIDMNNTEIDKLNLIKALIKTKKISEDTREHKKGCSEKPYDVFCKSFSSDNLSRSKFYELYNPIIATKISNSIFKYCDKSISIVEILKDLDIDSIKALYVLCKDIRITIDKFCDTFQLSKTEEKNQVKELFKIIKSYKSVYIYDALCYLLIDNNHNDVCIENKILYYRIFSNMQNIKNKIVIYNPNLLFIDKFINDETIDNKDSTLFVVENAMIMDIIKFKYNSLNVYTFDSFLHLLSDEKFEIEDSLLLFNGNTISNKVMILDKVLDRTPSKKALIFSSDNFQNSILQKYSIEQITLFPSGINYCTLPERKSLFSIKENAKKTLLSKYSIVKNSDIQYIALKANQYEVDLNSDFGIKIRSYFDSKEKESEFKRNKAGIISPTKEIKVYWTASEQIDNEIYKEIRIYVKEPIIKNNKIIEGSQVKKSIRKLSNYSYSQLSDFILGSYLKDPNENEYITYSYIPKLKELYKGKEITLQCLLILFPEFINNLSEIQLSIYNDSIGNEIYDMIPSKINLDYIEEVSRQLFNDDNDSITVFKYILHKLFTLSINNGYSSHNPLRNEYKRICEDERRINEVINNLSSSRISDNSTIKFINVCVKNIKNESLEYIGALLRITTPLSTQLIRALKWSDFKKVTLGNTSFYQLLIRRQIDKGNTKYISLSKSTQYIRLPLPSFIGELLNECWNNILSTHQGVSETELRQMPMVIGDDYIIDGYGVISYEHLDRIIKNIVDENNLISKKLIYVLDKNNDLVLKELSTKNTDVFRIFYKNRCEDTELDRNEISYLCGNKPYDTYAINYCDYDNDFSQLELFKKIERMFSQIFIKENNKFNKYECKGTLHYVSNNTNRSELLIEATNVKKINIKSRYGFLIRINHQEGRNK